MKRISIRKFRDKRYRMRFKYAEYYKSLSVDKSVILFESFHGKEISDSPLAMAKALLAKPESKNFRLFFSTNDMTRDMAAVKELGINVDLVHIHSYDYAKLLATAGYLINNSSFPSYFIRRDGQTYLQTWHGTPWKTLGKMMKGGIETMHNVQHNFIQASHLLFPNDFTREVIMRDYNLEKLFTGKAITHGYPRNAIFCNKEKAAETKRRCGDDGISTLAYMPTWRGADNKNIETEDFCKEMQGMLTKLDAYLADDQKLYVNLHPIIQRGLDTSNLTHIHPFPRGIDKYEFINSADALITDYSSILFDYSITGKPIILFTYDYDNYTSERGMYFDIDELPFIRVDTLDEMAEMLRERSYIGRDYSGNEKYLQRFVSYDTITADDDVMTYILTGEKGSMRADDFGYNRNKKWNLIDCPKLLSPFDLDVFSDTVDPDRDIVIFHQTDFSERKGKRFSERYKDAYEYIFVTDSVPETVAEALSEKKTVRKNVYERNLKRQVGDLTIDKVKKYKPITVRVESFRLHGTDAHVRLSCPVNIRSIDNVVLEYRSDIESISHNLPHTEKIKGNRYYIDIIVDMSVLKRGCVYWDIYVVANDAKIHAMLSKWQRRLLKTGFYQCEINGEGNEKDITYIAFPHISLFGSLAFTYREKTVYDDRATRIKEFGAYVFYRIFGRFYNRKNIWLVFEKFCSAAQDNGYYFFKYCMDNLSESDRRNIFFVIDRSSKDYANLKPYSRQVIQFMSFRHMVYCIAARVYVGSDSRKHLYIWRPKPNLISGRMRRKPIYFLQHGVTALKRVDDIFGANGSSPMTHITTTSEYEQKIMDEYFGYSRANAPIVGFTRWDVLEDRSTPDEKLILVMPTWRSWLEEKTDEDFLASEYFRNYMELLKNDSLAGCLKENDVKLIFFIHTKFKNFLSIFSVDCENIELVQFGSKPLNEIMMHCSMLITDYSSVCWDVYYMGKPVVFYQFDYDMYMENHGSYLDMEKDLFGERYTELPDVIESIMRNIENNFSESERAREMRHEYFKYIDTDNSKRTYDYLKKCGY